MFMNYWINEKFITVKKLANDFIKTTTISFENRQETWQM